MLTVQQSNLIQALLSGKYKNNTHAAIAVGYSPKSAKVSVSRLVTNVTFRAELEKERERQKGQHADRAKKEDSVASLREQKLALEVALSEAKLQALQPETDLEDAAAVRESWGRTIAYIYKEAVRICTASSADAALALVDGLLDAIETRSCLGVFDADAPDKLAGWPLDAELTGDTARRVQAEAAQEARAIPGGRGPYKPRNAQQLAETSEHHDEEN